MSERPGTPATPPPSPASPGEPASHPTERPLPVSIRPQAPAGPYPVMRQTEVTPRGAPFHSRPQKLPDASLPQPSSASPQQGSTPGNHRGGHDPGPGAETEEGPRAGAVGPSGLPAARLSGRAASSAETWGSGMGRRQESRETCCLFSSNLSPQIMQ